MGTQELMKIKQYQRDFEEKFGKKLYISWPDMKGVVPRISSGIVEPDEVSSRLTADDILKEVVDKHGTTIDAVRDRSKRVHLGNKHKERNALMEFCKIISRNRINRGYAAKLINRDRTTIYHFAKLADVQEV